MGKGLRIQSLSQYDTKFLTVLCKLSESIAQLSAQRLHERRGMLSLTRTEQKFLSFAFSSLWKLIPGLTGLSYKLDAVVLTYPPQNHTAWWSEGSPSKIRAQADNAAVSSALRTVTCNPKRSSRFRRYRFTFSALRRSKKSAPNSR